MILLLHALSMSNVHTFKWLDVLNNKNLSSIIQGEQKTKREFYTLYNMPFGKFEKCKFEELSQTNEMSFNKMSPDEQSGWSPDHRMDK